MAVGAAFPTIMTMQGSPGRCCGARALRGRGGRVVIIQPRLNAWMAASREARDAQGSSVLAAGVLVSGAYGGYFGAAQGVLVIGLLGSFLADDLQRVNAAKNVLVTIVNATAAVLVILFAQVNWIAVLLIAAGATGGGPLRAPRREPRPPRSLPILVVRH